MAIDTTILGKPLSGRLPRQKTRTISMEEAKEHGLQLWPKWAPVAALAVMIVTPLVTAIAVYSVDQYRVGQAEKRIESIEMDREVRRGIYDSRIRTLESSKAVDEAAISDIRDQIKEVKEGNDKIINLLLSKR